ncbi:MAG: putative aminohydrolase SsnA [Victivallales bacterium]|nr:putative aminohydrolase SsnA [Victivallales bacterium]
MSKLLIKNGTVVTLGKENRIIPEGYVLIKDNIIEEFGSGVPAVDPDTEEIDASGKLIMPGFINQHMHFYSTFARGLCPKLPPPSNFREVLEKLWWPLDYALNKEDVYYSTLVAAMNGIKKGVTTFFDHHESQQYQSGSLDIIEEALRETGVRGNLSLGVSDRYGNGKAGIEENIRFAEKIRRLNSGGDELITSNFGFHAMFTVEDESLHKAAEAAKDLNCGFHVHVAEGELDKQFNLKKYGKTPLQRLFDSGCLGGKTTAVHCIFITDKDIGLIKDSGTPVVHIPQSNMNNGVGVAPVLEILKNNITVGLGTDGISPGVLDDVRAANFVHKLNKKDPRVFFAESCQLILENNSKISSRFLSRNIGELKKGTYADIITVDYDPPTPLNEDTFYGHFLFGICEAKVDTTVANGKVLMKNGKLTQLDEHEVNAESRKQAADFWKRF